MSQVRQQATTDRAAEDRRLLAYLLEQEGIAPTAQPPIARRPGSGDPPLSFAQQRLWFLHQLEPDSAAYNMPLALRLTGTLDVAALKRALEEIVRRHETLRTTFVTAGGPPLQVIAADIRLPFSLHDLRDRPDAERAVEALQITRDEIQRPFDLAVDPPLRCVLIRLAEAEHVLVITIHHIVSDGWSLGVLNRELTALYAAFIAGEPSPLPPLQIQYADFACWQRAWLQGDVLERQVAYWRRQLAGATTLELPTDRPRPARQTYVGALEAAQIGPELTRQLRALSQREGVTLAITLSAAFNVLLHRWTGQDDIVVGSPIANRTRSDVEGLIGCFVNSLVMRTDISGNPSFRDLLGRVRTTALAAYENQDLPFEQLVQELQPERDPSRQPLFQVVLAVHNPAGADIVLPGLRVEPFPLEFTTTRFDLECHVWDRGEGLDIVVFYNTDLFDQATIARMLGHFQTVLGAVVADPENRISRVALLTPAEVEGLERWRTKATPYPRDATIADLFEAQVARAPEAIAVTLEGETLTYAELNRRANQLAHYLRRHGVGPDVLVGLCLERGVQTVVGMLGILKAGGAYVALDPEYPQARLALLIADTRAPVVLTERRLADRLPPFQGIVVSLDADWTTVAQESAANPANGATAETLALVIYTSGSTGQPKGVCLPHRGVTRLVCNTNYWQLRPEDRVAQVSSTTFDASTLEIWGALLHGAALVVIAKEVALSPPEFVATLRERGVTVLFLTTALFNQVARQVPGAFRGLRYTMFGGEAADPPSVRKVLLDGPPEQLLHLYGPAESTTLASWYRVEQVPENAVTVPIGWPVANTQLYVLDEALNAAPVGVPGELYVGGDGLAREYLNQPALTAERFVMDPERGRLYRTGDVVRYRPDGALEFLGRRDQQVKIRGYRVELGEVEAVLSDHPAVHRVVAVVREDVPGDKRLVAYLVPARNGTDPLSETGTGELVSRLRAHLKEKLPAYLVPSAFVLVEALPLSPNGKVDRRALPPPDGRERGEQSVAAPRNELETRIARVWRTILRVGDVGIHDNFFDVGGHSLLLIELRGALVKELGRELSIVDLFEHPTIESVARLVDGRRDRALADEGRSGVRKRRLTGEDDAIAIIGMSGRFPGAANLESFWANLRAGQESIRFFTDDELRAAGVPDALVGHPKYVKARGVLDDSDLFDAAFFGYSPREAELTDPQQRIFLECAWEALERAGYDPERYSGLIGVFAGAARNGYAMDMTLGAVQAVIGNDRDFLPTRVSYKLNLRGPSINVQTACSTSLVAIHLACQSLSNGDCDIVLAGGVAIPVPQVQGYLYQEDSILSPDGHCRTFDARARGTVSGSGVGIVVLQRLSDALRDGSHIHAVIRGTAINNDGSLKVGYTAPGLPGQVAVIASAQVAAGVDPGSIGYIEAHGTATTLGDPIEVEALTRAFGRNAKSGRCALGSLKTNLGHLDAAAGVAALIKTALCVEHGELVPSLHFEHPNPAIELSSGPFYVNTECRAWTTTDGAPRRAGVSSFGIGGTNAHAVLEQAPAVPQSGTSRPWQTLTLSARNPGALDRAAARLADHLKRSPDAQLPDVAYTLQVGRREFEHRRIVLAQDVDGAVEALEGRSAGRLWSAKAFPTHRGVIFMFPGQGSQYPNMGRELYDREPVYRSVVDECAERSKAALGFDVRDRLYPAGGASEAASANLRQTLSAQVSLFAVELGLARLWMSWGIAPAACIGHSIGEYVAACLAEVLPLEDVLKLVILRGRLMDQAPPGAMLAVPLAKEQVQTWLQDGLWLSAVNGRSACVVSGVPERVDELEHRLRGEGVECRRLHTSGAFHSGLMNGVVEPLTEAARRLRPGSPKIPYVSNVTGAWTNGDVKDPAYWGRHLREPVRFDQGVSELLAFGARVFLEVGPGNVLSTLVRQRINGDAETAVLTVPSLRKASESGTDAETMARAVGRLWLAGTAPDWSAYYAAESRRRVELPTYPFERERYWIAPSTSGAPELPRETGKRSDVADWFYLPLWKQTGLSQPHGNQAQNRPQMWLVFVDAHGIGEGVAARLQQSGHDVVRVAIGKRFREDRPGRYRVDPAAPAHYRALAHALVAAGKVPDHIVHAWSITPGGRVASGRGADERALTLGFYSLLHIVQGLKPSTRQEPLRTTVLTNHVHQVTGREAICPAKAALLGFCLVAPQEYPTLRCASIDLEWPVHQPGQRADVLDRLADELLSPSADTTIAYRGTGRWVQEFTPVRLDRATPQTTRLRQQGVYLITGGLGAVAFALATHLAQTLRAKLVLVGRTPLPQRSDWDRWLETHGQEDATSLGIRRVEALERFGAEVLVMEADVADVARMRAVVQEAEARFGALHGVIHAAGTTSRDTFKMLERLTPADCERQFRPKVHGTAALADALADRPLDFCLLTSSLSTVLGGLEFGAYVAANCVEDSFAQQQTRRGRTPWISVDWDGWQRDSAATEDAPGAGGAARFAMAAAEGAEAFSRILGVRRVSRVVVSTGDVAARMIRSTVATGPAAQDGVRSPAHPRPDVGTPFVAPSDEVETAVATLWQEMLGIGQVGVEDDFFELGGDSLIAVQLMFRLSTGLNTELTTQMLFDASTVRRLAATVRQAKQAQDARAVEVAQVFAMVDGLSDEEVRRVLAEEGPGTLGAP